jgi:hypothetical protein
VFARGDRRLGAVLEKAWRLGCQFDGWSEHFQYDRWLAAFREAGVDPDFYACRERAEDEIFPWDHLDAGPSKAFLLNEWHHAQRAETTPDCRLGCEGCGMTRYEGVCV